MFEFIRDMFKTRNAGNKKDKTDTTTKVSKSLGEILTYFREAFDQSADLVTREIGIDGTQAVIISISGMIDKDVLANSVIVPIRDSKIASKSAKEKFEFIKYDVLATAEQSVIETYEDAVRMANSGFALLAIDGHNEILAIGIQGFNFRSVSEPTSEMMQRASKEGFVEPLAINTTMIRRRMKTPKLKFENMSLGSYCKTDISLCYLTDMVSKEVLENVKEKIKSSNLQTLLSSGYLAPYLEEKKNLSLFSSVGVTERPDTVCAKIAEGRIAIIVDGTPYVLIVPYLFLEYFHSMDDYSMRPYFATLSRWLKYFAFLISILLPGIYVAMCTFSPELLPNELIYKVSIATATTPFSLVFETLILYLVYEVMREAGLRLPQNLGHAVSIVGGLVIGQAAVESGLVSGPTLVVVALTALTSYVIPNLYEPVSILRLAFIIVGGILGVWGVMLLFTAVLVDICSKMNYGIPFFAPLSPFNWFGMRDVIVRMGWKTLAKKTYKVQDMPGSNSSNSK